MALTQINKLPDVEIISGDTVEFNCSIVSVTGSTETLADITSCSLVFCLSYYGQEETNIFQKNCIISDGIFKLILTSTETETFNAGAYTQQYISIDP